MGLRVLVTYLPNDKLTDIPTIEIDVVEGIIILNGYDLTPALSLKVKELAVQLHSFYLDLEDGKDKEK